MMIDAPEIPEAEDNGVKNAGDRRAIHMAANTVNERRAAFGLTAIEDDPVVAPSDLISHTQTELGEIQNMANKVQYIIGTLARTLEVLRRGVADYINESEIEALLQLAQSYAESAADKECDTLIMKIMCLERTLEGANQ